ncbi:MAG TPA: hypothetical protein PLR32_01475 [candidate division Zixibacteria bacterium]|nr:hypothetical protein [candidate division Zixibacteria bacterium]MDD4916493.1 hypothetical protein [candidate division Zixibacteria bacterium]MDM7973365.1 hypothetical protein [candidate division Zixibacteria bacterium]HPI31955.1 hypothetical protein [candidate division Zixibacteria bacterium]HPM38668.1 hypothetical protein [candidate division Zixibacteria bacterium]
MYDCQHLWKMKDIQFGFVVFEKCFHCHGLRTYFTTEDNPIPGEKYREGVCFWTRMEVAQSFQFNLQCALCGRKEDFSDLMGLLHCTGCLEDCPVEVLQRELHAQRIWVLVAFGYLPKALSAPASEKKLAVLSEYFNQSRDRTRSQIRIVSSSLISNLSLCKGDFIHDSGMLSLEPPQGRRQLF